MHERNMSCVLANENRNLLRGLNQPGRRPYQRLDFEDNKVGLAQSSGSA